MDSVGEEPGGKITKRDEQQNNGNLPRYKYLDPWFTPRSSQDAIKGNLAQFQKVCRVNSMAGMKAGHYWSKYGSVSVTAGRWWATFGKGAWLAHLRLFFNDSASQRYSPLTLWAFTGVLRHKLSDSKAGCLSCTKDKTGDGWILAQRWGQPEGQNQWHGVELMSVRAAILTAGPSGWVGPWNILSSVLTRDTSRSHSSDHQSRECHRFNLPSSSSLTPHPTPPVWNMRSYKKLNQNDERLPYKLGILKWGVVVKNSVVFFCLLSIHRRTVSSSISFVRSTCKR